MSGSGMFSGSARVRVEKRGARVRRVVRRVIFRGCPFFFF